MAERRIYLDNAATSWPKPDSVYEAVDRYLRLSGAPAGRSVYAEANQANQTVAAARAAAARFIGAGEPRRIVFTLNGTDALNTAIHGLLSPGDHVVTTVAEHNSVLRPLRALEEIGGVEVTRVGSNARGFVDPADVRAAFRPNTRLVAATHASNVTGTIQPIADFAALAHQADALLLVDAAQTLGYLPIHVGDMDIDLLASPGHKGLLGPLGTGLLYVRPGVEARVRTTRQGGTGTQSDDDHHPDTMPHKFEAGSLNVPGIVGLGAGLDFLRLRGDEHRAHHLALTERLVAGLLEIGGVKIYGPVDARDRVGVVSITVVGFDPQEVAAMLDGAHRVQVRSGFHCAPLMHRALGTHTAGGTVRFSIGLFNTEADIDTAVAAVAEIAAEAHV
jgi:cysteine desulfurase family protein